ncbi:hypothetical protein HOLleu_38303 [Holothuria leucospilota]|uniref:Uncharacterized protein n=1 Tax=Holothuria leucospilota TaxID=206669 RepID=A0A9Q1BFF0_HOLLE|nr:hypothetical protein HOLleu_38303 [Holothuria leucospilota]
MAGSKSGVHQRILEKNNLAGFCDNHLLNLVGVHAAKQDTVWSHSLEQLNLSTCSFPVSHSAGKTENAVPVVVKKESETRWSARAEAVKPVNEYLCEILQVLEKMIDNENQTTETRSDAEWLYHCMLSYDFLTLLGFWDKILIRIDRVQKKLKDPTMNFDDAPMKALQYHFNGERDVLHDQRVSRGKTQSLPRMGN